MQKGKETQFGSLKNSSFYRRHLNSRLVAELKQDCFLTSARLFDFIQMDVHF